MPSLSVIVITKNEGKNIERCLESVKWADEIIVIDDYSVDKTVDICKKYTQNICQNKFISFSQQKKFAFSKANKEWVFSIDADEVISDSLMKEILSAISLEKKEINGFYIPRKTFFIGKWIRHCGWYPDYQLRLFKNGKWAMKDVLVHESVDIEGKTRCLKEALLHYSYSNVFEYIERLNRYTTMAAQQMFKDEANIKKSEIEVLASRKARKTFWKMYIKQSGFMDGMHGLFLSFFSAVYQLMVYVKYWQAIDRGMKNEKA